MITQRASLDETSGYVQGSVSITTATTARRLMARP